MRKRIMAVLATAIILVPALTQSAFTQTPAHIMPESTLASFDFRLQDGRIKDLLEPLIENYRVTENDDFLDLMTGILLSGRQFNAGITGPEGILVTVPVVDSEWESAVEYFTAQGLELDKYGSTDVYSSGRETVARLGELAVFGATPELVQAAIDLHEGTATNSLENLTAYQDVTSSYLNPRMAGLTVNVGAIGEMITSAMGDIQEQGPVQEGDEQEGDAEVSAAEASDLVALIFDLFDFEGISVAEVSDGYKFTIDILGNAEKLAESEISLNPGGKFTPKLFNQFPNAKPLLYSESFNLKAGNEHSKKMMDLFVASAGENFDIYSQIFEETGVDINAIYNIFDKEFAVGLQYDQNSPLPYFTVLANVSSANKAAAKRLTDDLVDLLTDALKDGGVSNRAYDVEKGDEFTVVTMDVTKFEKDYSGPPFSEQVLTFGVTNDGLFIVSNYPAIEKANKRTGFGSDPSFSAYVTNDMLNTGIFYLNMRNLWGFMDAMLEWGEQAGGGEHGPPLEFYQDYYSAIEALYGWKDMFIVSNGTDSRTTVTGTIKIDSATHKLYEQLVSDIKSSDSDGDGVSDYDERYVYFTPVESGDSDNDGVNDVEELQRGTNPKGEGLLFNDVGESAYYTDEVGFLYQRGAISGYKDGSFQPGRHVNRAEFTTMVIGAFEQGTSNFLGVDVELKAKPLPFMDVNPGSWYYEPISKAYTAGFVSGSVDEYGNKIFRPGDTITRAEAIVILNSASTALKKTRPVTCTGNQFGDVKESDWFCTAVANGYANGVTSGRRAGEFDPRGLLNRAEAAVMIRRALEKDLEVFEAGTESFGELTAPLGKSLAPAASSLKTLY